VSSPPEGRASRKVLFLIGALPAAAGRTPPKGGACGHVPVTGAKSLKLRSSERRKLCLNNSILLLTLAISVPMFVQRRISQPKSPNIIPWQLEERQI